MSEWNWSDYPALDYAMNSKIGKRPPPVPSKDDELFGLSGPHKIFTAMLTNSAWCKDAKDVPYVEGYLRGAHALLIAILNRRHDIEFLVYPLIFLYRHHIELLIKSLIESCRRVTRHNPSKEERANLNQHGLDRLWADLAPLYRSVCNATSLPAPASGVIEGIDEYIRQFQRVDSRSFAFRYPNAKDGSTSIPEETKQINVLNFAELAERLIYQLNLMESAIEMHDEWISEKGSEL